MPDATFGNPVGVSPECPSYGNHNHLDCMQTPGIPGCEGVRQNKAAVRQCEEPVSTRQSRSGSTPPSVCLSSRSSQSSLLQTVPPSLAQRLECPTSVGDFKIKKISYTPQNSCGKTHASSPSYPVLLLSFVILSLSGKPRQPGLSSSGCSCLMSQRTQQAPLGLFPASSLLPWARAREEANFISSLSSGISCLCSLYANSVMLPFSEASCHLPLL